MESQTITASARFRDAVARMRAAHQEDPRLVLVEGRSLPWSLLYHQRLEYWLLQLTDTPSEALLLAANAQHIRRWKIPRETFSPDRNGYLKWRRKLAHFHRQQAGAILRDTGYDPPTIERVGDLIRKHRLKREPEVQLFENAICLVFLELELTEFLKKHPQTKVVEILRKTWVKMSLPGQRVATALLNQLPPPVARLARKANLSLSDDKKTSSAVSTLQIVRWRQRR